MFFEVKMQQGRCSSSNSSSNCTRFRIEKGTDNKEHTAKEIYRIYRNKKRVMFWPLTDNMKGKYDTFSSYKQRNKVCFIYLECKPPEASYGLCVFKLKW